MKKIILPILFVFSASLIKVQAQVGLNTTTPTATVDIKAKNATGTTTNVDGLLIPRVDRQRAQSMTGVPTSTIIYVNSIATGNNTGIAANIDAVGYYYFDGMTWVKFNSGGGGGEGGKNIYNSDGTLLSDRNVLLNNKYLRFTQPGFEGNYVEITDTPNSAKISATGSLIGALGLYSGTSKLDIFQTNSGFSTISSSGGSQGLQLKTNDIDRITITKGGSVGLGTSTPNAQLETTGNVIIGSAPSTQGATGYSTLVRDNSTGEVRVATSSTGNTTPINYITYTLQNVEGDWLNNFNTRIDINKYTVVVTGSSYDSKSQSLKAASGDFNPLNVYAFQYNGTWRLSADYSAAGPGVEGENGTWTLYCLVINNSIVKTLEPVTKDLKGQNAGIADSEPSGL